VILTKYKIGYSRKTFTHETPFKEQRALHAKQICK